mmetsp:Transcript_90338/g.170323  ORF Transcript_90338/g.170323 Transcript_90338/m.170323 type:complete len:419 (-) Transcript_90338:89-1345(-)
MAAVHALKQLACIQSVSQLIAMLLVIGPSPAHTIQSTNRAGRSWLEAMISEAGGTSEPTSQFPIPLSGAPGFSNQAKQYLIVTSPSQGKVVYAQVNAGSSTSKTARALVDAGLVEPRGVAVHAKSGWLFIADAGANSIFHYNLLIDDFSLQTNGGRITIVENSTVDSVCVDDDGNLYYTSGSTNNINKIPFKVLERLIDGSFEASALELVNAKELMAEAAVTAQMQIDERGSALPTDAPDAEPIIYSLYEASINPLVSEPGAIQADGSILLWTNKNDGGSAGTVVQGETDPQLPPLIGNSSALRPFPAEVLTRNSNAAYGLILTPSSVFWTTNETQDNTGVVWGQLLELSTTAKLMEGLMAPRGLVWDRDGTAYVADEVLGNVFSFPTGRMMDNAPAATTINLKGPYGLALVTIGAEN